MRRYLAALLASALALSPLYAAAELMPPPGMTPNAANATLPDARTNLGIVAPTITTYTAAASGTYTTPAGAVRLFIRACGAGGGGSGGGDLNAPSPAAGTGGATTFSSLTANGGVGGDQYKGGLGGTATGGTINVPGMPGIGALPLNPSGSTNGGTNGGSGWFGAGGRAIANIVADGSAGVGNGSGGAGGGTSATARSPGLGGGAGGCLEATITSPSATYAYAVGTAGTAGGAGTNGRAGGAGTDGIIVIYEFKY